MARAIDRIKEQASNNIINIENEIKMIDNVIENQVLSASIALKKSLNNIEHEMSNIFDTCSEVTIFI